MPARRPMSAGPSSTISTSSPTPSSLSPVSSMRSQCPSRHNRSTAAADADRAVAITVAFPLAASCSSTRADPSSSRSTSSTTTTSREPAAVASTAAATCVAVSWPSSADVGGCAVEHAGERLERRAAGNSPTNNADDAGAGRLRHRRRVAGLARSCRCRLLRPARHRHLSPRGARRGRARVRGRRTATYWPRAARYRRSAWPTTVAADCFAAHPSALRSRLRIRYRCAPPRGSGLNPRNATSEGTKMRRHTAVLSIALCSVLLVTGCKSTQTWRHPDDRAEGRAAEQRQRVGVRRRVGDPDRPAVRRCFVVERSHRSRPRRRRLRRRVRAARRTPLDPCQLVTSAEASALAGTTFGAGVESTNNGGGRLRLRRPRRRTCSRWSSRRRPDSKTANDEWTQEEAQAQAEIAQAKCRPA